MESGTPNVWVDGRAGGSIDYRDRGFNYGDGLFETMRVTGRCVRLLDYHLERLELGCERLGFAPQNMGRLRKEFERIAARRSEGVLKLVVTRGVGRRGYRPSGRERCTRVISLHALSRRAAQALAGPARVRLCSTRLGTNEALAGLKTLNRLECVLARAEWSDVGLWEGLMRDGEDFIVCGTMSNVFVRTGSRLLTPKLDRCGVAGVMRRWVLEQAGALRLRVGEARLRWRDFGQAQEVFMTNAVAGIVPISDIVDGRSRVRLRAEERKASAALSGLLHRMV
jgi:4-amino-4-deoxychorismate lyase